MGAGAPFACSRAGLRPVPAPEMLAYTELTHNFNISASIGHAGATPGVPSRSTGSEVDRDLRVLAQVLQQCLGDPADLLRPRLLLELVAHLVERRDLLTCLTRLRLLLLGLRVERPQLLLGRLGRAVLVGDELLDHHLGLDL